MADLSPDAVTLLNALPSAIGAAVGGFVAGLGPFRKRLRREARAVVRDELERHEREHHGPVAGLPANVVDQLAAAGAVR